MIHRILVGTALLVGVNVAHAQRPPTPSAALKEALREPARVVVVQDTADVYWAVQAGHVRLASPTSITVPSGVDVIVFEDRVRELGKGERKPLKGDFIDTLRDTWYPPFTKRENVHWLMSTQQPAAMIQITKGRFAVAQTVIVKAVITWWCRTPDATCHSPK